jgi:3-hydroxyisobutyrate dehydrogenase-like beta-hydroxyacid dehydrogenase
LYLDANSISPKTVAQIAEVLRDASVDFVDGAIFGLASQLQTRGTLYLSGSRATELLDQFGSLIAVKVAEKYRVKPQLLK